MSFVNECIADSMPIWEQCLDTPFLRGVADGTLPEDRFKGYIADDSLYLREYAKVFAWGILKANDMEEIRVYYSLLSFVQESEDVTRKYYIERYNLDDCEVQKLPLRPQNQAYVNEMLNASQRAETPAECMMSALPCMLSYAWIFCEMLKRSPQVLKTPYGRFVSDYAGTSYDELCAQWVAFAEKACESLSDEQKSRCKKIFFACSVHELHFWEMSAQPRNDI